MLGCLVTIAKAQDTYYIFESYLVDDSLRSRYTASTNDFPLMIEYNDDRYGGTVRYYRVFVNQAQHSAGWDALDPAIKSAAKLAAEEYSKSYENWDTKLQAVIDTLYDEINVIREDNKIGLPPITDQEKKDKIKNKKKEPKTKKKKRG